MKLSFKIILGVLLVTVYSLVFSAVLNWSMSYANHQIDGHSYKYEWTKAPSYSLIQNTELDNAITGTPERLNSFESGKELNLFVWLPSTEDFEHIFCAAFKQYKKQALNRLINFRKSDIIFPFHYFW